MHEGCGQQGICHKVLVGAPHRGRLLQTAALRTAPVLFAVGTKPQHFLLTSSSLRIGCALRRHCNPRLLSDSTSVCLPLRSCCSPLPSRSHSCCTCATFHVACCSRVCTHCAPSAVRTNARTIVSLCILRLRLFAHLSIPCGSSAVHPLRCANWKPSTSMSLFCGAPVARKNDWLLNVLWLRFYFASIALPLCLAVTLQLQLQRSKCTSIDIQMRL